LPITFDLPAHPAAAGIASFDLAHGPLIELVQEVIHTIFGCDEKDFGPEHQGTRLGIGPGRLNRIPGRGVLQNEPATPADQQENPKESEFCHQVNPTPSHPFILPFPLIHRNVSHLTFSRGENHGTLTES
jgi:hypothetical protein